MEGKHLSIRIRSGYLLTLIFSFTDYFERIEALLQGMSKRGSLFFINNAEQLKYFCQQIPKKSLNLTFSTQNAAYYSPSHKNFQKLIVIIQGIKDIDFASLHQIAENPPSFKELQLLGDLSIDENSLENTKKVQEKVIESLAILISKAISLDASKLKAGYLIANIIQAKPERMAQLRNASFHLDQDLVSHTKDICTVPKLTGVSSIFLPTQSNFDPVAALCGVWNQLEEIELAQDYQSALPSYSWSRFQILEAGMPKLANLRVLKIKLFSDCLKKNYNSFTQLRNLEEFYGRHCLFEFSILSHWSKLHTLEISNQFQLFNQKNFDNLLQLKYLSLIDSTCFSEAKNLQFWICLAKSQALQTISFVESFQQTGSTFLRQNTSVREMRYYLQSSSYKNLFSQLHQGSQIKVLKIYHGEDYPKAVFKKIAKPNDNYTIEKLKLKSEVHNKKTWNSINIALLKNLRKLEIVGMNFEKATQIQGIFQQLLLVKKSKLKQLKLKHVKFNFESIEYLMQFLKNPHFQLTALKLIEIDGINHLELLALAECMSSSVSLKTFKLDAISFCTETMQAFIQGVGRNKNIENLKLQIALSSKFGYRIQFNQLKELLLKHCTHLRKLEIELNCLFNLRGLTGIGIMEDDLHFEKKELVRELRLKMPDAEEIKI